jgi:1-acyl-sn-glycerol-3-phosphate acyltransferase
LTQPSLLSRAVFRVIFWIYRLRGWQVSGRLPKDRKFVLVGAPHTSNWDFPVFLGATQDIGIRPSYLGKHSLFRWPLKRFMVDMGGIPINRSKPGNYVQQVAAAFDSRDELALVIAPEGTRHSDGKWKSGFYHIAIAAGVPIVIAWIDRSRRQIGIGSAITPSGDYRADLKKIADWYRSVWPDQRRFDQMDREPQA